MHEMIVLGVGQEEAQNHLLGEQGNLRGEPHCHLTFYLERKWSCSVVSNSLQPHGLEPTRLPCSWDFPGKNTGVGCHILHCWRRNETPTLQSGLNLYILTLASYSCFILYPLHNNLQGKLPSTMIQRLYSAQGEITFTLAYLLQLRLCFGELPYQLRIHVVPRSVPFEESEKHPCVQAMFFSHGNKQDS